MKKRNKFIAAVLIIIFLVVSTTASNVKAYDNSFYFLHQNVKVGLETMVSASINITLNGEYTINGNAYSSGTAITISTDGTSIKLNGTAVSDLNIVPKDIKDTITIKTDVYTRRYHGSFSFVIKNGKITPVNDIYIEQYLKGVIGYEMYASYDIEALKAQAVAARNYALSNIGKHSPYYDLCDWEDCQVYKGEYDGVSDATLAKLNSSVDETKGIVMLYGNGLVQAYFSSSNGGYTEGSENVWMTALPYLKSKADSFDTQDWPEGMKFSQSWTSNSDSRHSGGSAKLSTIQGAYITFTFKGTGFKWIGSKGSQNGSAKVTIDGYAYNNISSYNSTESYQQAIYTSNTLSNVTHYVRIEALNASPISIDAFEYINSVGDTVRNEDVDVDCKKFTPKQIEVTLQAKNIIPSGSAFISIDTNNILRYPSGRVSSINILYKDASGSTVTKTLTKAAAYSFLNLPSSIYKVSKTKDSSGRDLYVFYDGKGFGHGIGMSQVGAQNRAVAGQSFSDILEFYYDGINLVGSLPKIQNITSSENEIYTDDGVNFNLSSTSGSGNGVLVRYEVEKDGNIVHTQDFSNSTNFYYKPKLAGQYTLHAYIRDASSNQEDFDDSSSLNFTVNFAGQGDVNVDKVVDIYDLVLISKNYGKQRGIDADYNERWNVDDSNNVIDIKDLSKAALMYNNKY